MCPEVSALSDLHHTDRGTRRGARYGRRAILPANLTEEQRDALVAAIGRLSDRQRQVLSLWVEGWTLREIAEKLNLHPGTVFRHAGRLKARMDAALAAICHADGADSD